MAQSSSHSRPSRTRVVLLSLTAATVIWLFNQLNKEGYTQQIRYPIKITYNDSLYIPLTALPKSITATITGDGWTLLRKSFAFTVKPVSYRLDNPLGTKTLNTSALSALMNEQVQDVRISNVVADTSSLDFDERVVKTSLLRIDSLAIDLQPKFVISSLVNITPRKVVFDGPAILVNDIADTILVKIPAKKIRGNYDEELLIPYPQSSLVKVSKDRVFVSFEVAEVFNNKQ